MEDGELASIAFFDACIAGADRAALIELSQHAASVEPALAHLINHGRPGCAAEIVANMRGMSRPNFNHLCRQLEARVDPGSAGQWRSTLVDLCSQHPRLNTNAPC